MTEYVREWGFEWNRGRGIKEYRIVFCFKMYVIWFRGLLVIINSEYEEFLLIIVLNVRK